MPAPPDGCSERKPFSAGGPIAGTLHPDDPLFIHAAYKIEPGLACRVKPESGAGDVSPPGAALFPGAAAGLRY
jgi:hypothetical protein